ncbi:MAG: glycoside hydrolase family 78 protein [Puniceicoccales bacterium]|jgi:alpha-L-rhamnosidase|nr:glycoside hydrolase family 78 protein [Puniceicoccales bacterium]
MKTCFFSLPLVLAVAFSANCASPAKSEQSAANVTVTDATKTFSVKELRVEQSKEPLGLDTTAPRFSWKPDEANAAVRAQRQTAYRLLVASSPEKLAAGTGDVWDSGVVKSGESHLVPFGGDSAKLKYNSAYHWKVLAYDRDNKASGWSAAARFSVGPLSREDWKGEWIKHPGTAPERHIWFRKKLPLAETPSTTFAHVASLGYHELYINGKKADARVLAPATSQYKKRLLYVTYDITALLHKGDNVVAVWYGPGWTIHRENTHLNQALLVQLDGTTSSGKAFTLHTDTTWKSAESNSREIGKIPRRMGGMGGEEVDARAAKSDWNKPAFDDSAWSTAIATAPLKTTTTWPALSAQLTDPSRLAAAYPAVKVTPAGNNAWRVDMGRAFTGFVQASFKGLAPGAVVTIRISDRTGSDEQFDQRQSYIARGEDGETFTNRFNFFNGRYIHIAGLKTAPAPADIVAVPVTSAAPRTGTFTSSSEDYARIYETDLWTYEMCNTEGVTVDCPSRERLGYGAETAYFTAWGLGLPAFDSAAFYRKNIRDWSDVQGPTGRIPNTAPQTYGSAWGGPISSSAIFNLAWEYYLANGDKDALESAFTTGSNWLKFAYKKAGKDGIPLPGFGAAAPGSGFFLGDWLAPGHRQEKDGEAPYYFNLGILALNLDLFDKIAGALGRADEAAPFHERLTALREAINKRYYKGDGVYFNGDQVRTTLALHAGVVPAAETKAVLAHLEKDLLGKHPFFDTGSFGRYPFFKVLFGNPRFNEIVDGILSKKTYPGYGHFLAKGETTWPECWEMKNDICARTHTSYTGISGWFVKVLAGIEPSSEGPGYRVFTLRPQVIKNLSFAAATLESPYGKIASGWRKENGTLVFEFEVPVGTTAKVTLPSKAEQWTESGKPLAQAEGVRITGGQGDTMQVELAAGKYKIKN